MSTSTSNHPALAERNVDNSGSTVENSASNTDRRPSFFSITRRRSSLLSKNMLDSEEHRYYRMGRTIDGSEQYKLSLSESQGKFIFLTFLVGSHPY